MMDAKELHRLMVAGRIVLADPTTGHPHMPADQEIAHRALSLLAAAEANDGKTPETDNPNNISWRATRDRSHRLERERNGLARAFADALEENAALREQLAERDAEIAALKGHAEAMAERLDAWARIDECKCSEVDAYRRDYPEGTK